MMQAEHGRVLVVLGNALRRERLRRQLEELDCIVISAGGTDEAATLVRDEEPDVVVIEAHAAPGGAAALLRTMQTEPTSATIPAIVLAPEGDSAVVQCCLDAGAEDFLYEPYSPSILKAQIRDYVAISSRPRQDLRRSERESLLKLESDVQIARKIQESFLPDVLPQPAGWEIAARFHPTREVAGDFYDSFQLTQGRRVALVIADVCDKVSAPHCSWPCSAASTGPTLSKTTPCAGRRSWTRASPSAKAARARASVWRLRRARLH